LNPPALVSNRELVDLFLGCLKETFRTQVEHSQNIQMSKDSKKKSVSDDKVRHPEDLYDIIEVIEMAETISGCAQGETSLNTTRHGVNTTEVKTTREPHTHVTPSYNIKLEEDLRELNTSPALFIAGQHFSLTTFHCSWYFQWLLFIAGYLKRESLLYGSAHGSGKWSHFLFWEENIIGHSILHRFL
jgi:hypothetical protein